MLIATLLSMSVMTRKCAERTSVRFPWRSCSAVSACASRIAPSSDGSVTAPTGGTTASKIEETALASFGLSPKVPPLCARFASSRWLPRIIAEKSIGRRRSVIILGTCERAVYAEDGLLRSVPPLVSLLGVHGAGAVRGDRRDPRNRWSTTPCQGRKLLSTRRSYRRSSVWTVRGKLVVDLPIDLWFACSYGTNVVGRQAEAGLCGLVSCHPGG